MKQILLLLATATLLAGCATTKRVADKGRELDVVTHCDPADYPTNREFYRSSDLGHSMDISIARRLALNKAKAKLAGDIKTDLEANTDMYSEQLRDNKHNDFAESFSEEISLSVSASLEEVETICSKLTKNSRTGEYTAYVTIQVPRNNVYSNVRDRLNKHTKK